MPKNIITLNTSPLLITYGKFCFLSISYGWVDMSIETIQWFESYITSETRHGTCCHIAILSIAWLTEIFALMCPYFIKWFQTKFTKKSLSMKTSYITNNIKMSIWIILLDMIQVYSTCIDVIRITYINELISICPWYCTNSYFI